MTNSIKSRLIRGSAWLTIARAIVSALGLASTFILAWYLTPSDYGLVAIGTTLLTILSAFTELSLGAALIHHAAPKRSHYDTIFTLNVLRGLLLALIVAASAYPISWFFEDARLVEIILALSVSMLLGGLGNPYIAFLQRQIIFSQEFAISVAQKMSGFIVAIGLAYYYQTYWALIFGALVSQATMVVVSYAVLPYRPSFTLREVRELFGFSGWLSASQVVNTLNWNFDTLLVGKILNPTLLGFYTVGSNISSMATREVTQPFTGTVFTGFANIRDNSERLAAAYQRVQALVTAIALPVGVGTALLADPLVRLAMGDKWLPIVFIIQVLAAVFAFQTLGTLVQPLAMSIGQTRLIFDRDWKLFALRVPVIAIALFSFGLPGVIFARVFTSAVGTVINLFMVRRLTDISILQQLTFNIRAICSTGIMAVGVSVAWHAERAAGVTELMQIVTLSALGGAIYCVSSLALWSLAGRRPGPETEIFDILRNLLGFYRRRSTSQDH